MYHLICNTRLLLSLYFYSYSFGEFLRHLRPVVGQLNLFPDKMVLNNYLMISSVLLESLESCTFASPDELVERPNPRHAPHLTEPFSQNQMQSRFTINQREKGENLFF